MKYYEMEMSCVDRWLLSICSVFSDGTPVDMWAYMRGELLTKSLPVPIKIRNGGGYVDINFTSFGCIIVSDRAGAIINRVAYDEVQLIPTLFDPSFKLFILNSTRLVDCIDYQESELQRYPQDHEKGGRIRGVMNLRLREDGTEGCHIFRLKGWEIVTIVSEELKLAFESCHVTGVNFSPVTN